MQEFERKTVIMLTTNRDRMTEEATAEAERLYGRQIDPSELSELFRTRALRLGGSEVDRSDGGVLASYHSRFFDGVRHSHDFFEMSFVLSGEAVDLSDGEEIVLKAGDAIVHPPQASHAITRCSEPNGLINVVLSREMLTDSFYSSLLRDKNLETAFFCPSPQGPTAISVRSTGEATRAVVALLLSELASPDRSQTVIESTLLLLLAQLLRGYKSKPRGLKAEIGEYLSENLSTVTLPAAAERFGYNPKYFSQLFKRLFSVGFGEQVRLMRLDYAAGLLERTDYPIEKIAELVGYRDPSALYVGFKKRFGVSPSSRRSPENRD